MPEKPELTEEEYRRRARRSLIVGGAASFAGYSGWRWIQDQPEVDNIPQVLRSGHELNESIWSSLFRDGHQARTFPRDSASVLRVNGTIGLRDEIDLDTWRLEVFGPDGAPLGTHTLDDVTALPRHEMTIEHKCIEGWAQITNWGGARFSRLHGPLRGPALRRDHRRLPRDPRRGVLRERRHRDDAPHADAAGLREPGQPDQRRNGAPLRLATPLKYGIKQIKRIGRSTSAPDGRPTTGASAATTGTPACSRCQTPATAVSDPRYVCRRFGGRGGRRGRGRDRGGSGSCRSRGRSGSRALGIEHDRGGQHRLDLGGDTDQGRRRDAGSRACRAAALSSSTRKVIGASNRAASLADSSAGCGLTRTTRAPSASMSR